MESERRGKRVRVERGEGVQGRLYEPRKSFATRSIYTPAYDPDANRIEWLWRWSRREVTHNHQRTTFAALLEDMQAHFEALPQHPNLVRRQIGSPCADQISEDPVLACAA